MMSQRWSRFPFWGAALPTWPGWQTALEPSEAQAIGRQRICSDRCQGQSPDMPLERKGPAPLLVTRQHAR